MAFPFNITNPGIWIEGILTAGERLFTTNLVGLDYEEGDILYSNSSGELILLKAGTNDEVLTLVSGIPSWEASAGGGSGGHTIEDEGVVLTQRTTMNFVGSGVTVTDAGSKTVVTISSSTGLLPSNNLSDLVNAGTARTNLGLGTAAQSATGAFATAAQGAKADSAQQPPSEGAFVNGDKTKLNAFSEANQTANNAKNTYPSGDATKVGHITVTQAVNLDTMESNIATNNAKVTNATHTGEVTGSGALTIANNAVIAARIADNAVTNSKIAGAGTRDATTFYRGDGTFAAPPTGGTVDVLTNVATARIIGRNTAGTGDSEELTAAQARTLLNVANGATANSTDATLLARANHTGTQLASTISDFAATVRATVLTGLSTASSAAVAAGDTILVAIGKLQAQVNLKSNSASPTFTGTVVLPANTVTNSMIAGTGTRNSTTFYRGDGTFAVPPGAGGGGNYFNDEQIDQSGGTSDTYGALAGTINGTNRVFTVSTAVYQTGTLTVYLNGQLQTQGTGQDWVETTPASGTFTFDVAPPTGSEITVVYQEQVLSNDTVVVVGGNVSDLINDAGYLTTATVSDGDKGDITVSGSGATWTVDNGVVTYAKTDAGVQASLDLADSASQATGVENNADVTDTANVTAAGALMDSEVTNLAQVKAFDSTDYAAALGTDDNYVTDAEKTVIGNTSGTNTGDQDLSGLAPKASPTFTGTVAGITAAMVGLGNVDNTSNSTERAATATLENKRIRPRVSSSASGNITPTKVNFDRYIRTAQSADITISNPTMDIGEVVAVQLTDNATARAITFGAHYMALDGLALPTTTTASKVMAMVLEKVTATKVLVSYVDEA